MRKFVIGIFVGIALLWLFIWNVVNEIYMSGGYGVDRNYAFVTTGQTMYTRMKDEEFEKEVGGKELKACVTLGDLYDLAVK